MNRKKQLVLMIALVNAFSLFSQDECKDILQQGVFNKYHIKTKQEYHSHLKRIFNMSYDELKKYKDSHNASVDGMAGIIEAFFSFGLEYSDEMEQYERLRVKYKDQVNLKIDRIDELELFTQVADKGILEAWSTCMNNKGISATLRESPCDTFLVTIAYNRTIKYFPNDIGFNISMTTAKLIEPVSLNRKPTLKSHSPLTLKFKRTNPTQIGGLVVDIDQIGSLYVRLPQCLFDTIETIKEYSIVANLRGLVYDDDSGPFGSGSEKETYDIPHIFKLKNDGSIYEQRFSKCVDNEVELKIHLIYSMDVNKTVSVRGGLQLFEGDQCGQELEKTKQLPAGFVTRGSKAYAYDPNKFIKIKDAQEDYATFNVFIDNTEKN